MVRIVRLVGRLDVRWGHVRPVWFAVWGFSPADHLLRPLALTGTGAIDYPTWFES